MDLRRVFSLTMTLQNGKVKGLAKWFHQPVDAATLGCFRLCWGFLMVLEALSRFSKVTGVYSPTYFHFKYPLFTWVQGFPAQVYHFLGGALDGSSPSTGQGQVCASTGQRPDHGQAQTRTTAGYEYNFSVQAKRFQHLILAVV